MKSKLNNNKKKQHHINDTVHELTTCNLTPCSTYILIWQYLCIYYNMVLTRM